MLTLRAQKTIAMYLLLNFAVSAFTSIRDAVGLVRMAPEGTAWAILESLLPLAVLLCLQGVGAIQLMRNRLRRLAVLAIPLAAQAVWFRFESSAYAFASGFVVGPVIGPSLLEVETAWSWTYWAERRVDGTFEYVGVSVIPVAVLAWLIMNRHALGASLMVTQTGSESGSTSSGGD